MPKAKLFIVNSPESKAHLKGVIDTEHNKHKYLRISIVTGKDRTSQINRLLHAWFNQISECRSEQSPIEVKNECKLRFFVPILRVEDEKFRENYDFAIKPLDYETKLKAIELMPVTSRCTNKQLIRGMEAMQMAYSTLGADSVFLEFPDEDGTFRRQQ
jgi:hypothetical protein